MTTRIARPDLTAQLCLMLMALVWLGVGVGILTGRSPVDPELLHTHVPDRIRCLWWIVPALMAVVTAATGRLSTLVLVLLSIGPLIRFGSLMWAWVSALIPGVPAGDPGAWYNAVFYAAMLGLVTLAARLVRARGPLGGNG